MLGFFMVGTLTAGAAYYLPLHRAHKALTEQYAALQKKADADDADLKRLKTDLASVEADREKLQAAQGQQEARQRADRERDGKLRELLTSKLAPYAKSHLTVAARAEGGTAVLIPAGLVRIQGVEITDPGKNALCTIIRAMSSAGSLSYRVGAFVTHADAAVAGPREEAASRAVNAARTMEEKCAVPGTRILGAGFVQPPTSGDGALGGDLLELDVALL